MADVCTVEKALGGWRTLKCSRELSCVRCRGVVHRKRGGESESASAARFRCLAVLAPWYWLIAEPKVEIAP